MQDFNAMKSESKQMNRMKAVVLLLALACVNGYAQENNSSKGEDGSTSKEEGNRNVMLNAASANGPREIQIGLPSADVNVLENGIPVTYATNPHSVNSLWRADASLSHVGLLKISETAITTGNIGYAVNSFTQLGEKGRSLPCKKNTGMKKDILPRNALIRTHVSVVSLEKRKKRAQVIFSVPAEDVHHGSFFLPEILF